MADGIAAGRTDLLARQQRELRSLVSGVGDGMRRLATVSEEVNAELAERAEEFDAACEQPHSRELAARLRDLAAAMHQAIRRLGGELDSVGTRVEQARTRAAAFEKPPPAPLPEPHRRPSRLHSREDFDQRLAFLLATSPFRAPWCLVLADLDGLDALTERHPVSACDMLLSRIARMVGVRVQNASPEAFAAQYDDSVFAVLVPGEPAGARRLAERLRDGIASVSWTVSGRRGETELSTTASVGVAAYRRGDAPDTLVRRARQAVLQARQQGGNRVAAD
jgi:diguanylate cyclase (GGDEF)-like protein